MTTCEMIVALGSVFCMAVGVLSVAYSLSTIDWLKKEICRIKKEAVKRGYANYAINQRIGVVDFMWVKKEEE